MNEEWRIVNQKIDHLQNSMDALQSEVHRIADKFENFQLNTVEKIATIKAQSRFQAAIWSALIALMTSSVGGCAIYWLERKN